jgi:hypothetical protein
VKVNVRETQEPARRASEASTARRLILTRGRFTNFGGARRGTAQTRTPEKVRAADAGNVTALDSTTRVKDVCRMGTLYRKRAHPAAA